jgi:hypothetical protein
MRREAGQPGLGPVCLGQTAFSRDASGETADETRHCGTDGGRHRLGEFLPRPDAVPLELGAAPGAQPSRHPRRVGAQPRRGGLPLRPEVMRQRRREFQRERRARQLRLDADRPGGGGIISCFQRRSPVCQGSIQRNAEFPCTEPRSEARVYDDGWRFLQPQREPSNDGMRRSAPDEGFFRPCGTWPS